MGVTVDVRRFAMQLPRTTEGIVRDSVRFRIGQIVYLRFSWCLVRLSAEVGTHQLTFLRPEPTSAGA
jgi:hypothetical protein